MQRLLRTGCALVFAFSLGCPTDEPANDDDSATTEDCAQQTWFADSDGDGFGDPTTSLLDCAQPAGFVADATDCDDAESAVAPNAPELCDSIDNNCDGLVDVDAEDESTWYLDADGDGAGSTTALGSCTQPADHAATDDDCDDGDPTVFPGNLELCDGLNNDCEPATTADGGEDDSDGDGARACDDCDDADATTYPGAPELCDALDNDCDPTTVGLGESDADGDGALACDDCDDVDAASFPGGTEICDGLDNDCDGAIDSSPAVPGDTDADGITDLCDVCPGFDDLLDTDGDTVADGCDVCPLDPLDDSDGDSVCDSDDACPGEDDALDGDGDGAPDACDICPLDALDDSDGDGSCDTDDICPGSDDAVDTDTDGTPDGCDACPADNPDDSDGDTVCDSDDVCDGEDDTLDGDNDGTPDACDICPLDALDDSDGDGSCDTDDLCPGSDDAVDGDSDGVPDGCDVCPTDPLDDSDGDGVCDSADACPGFDDTVDTDTDGVPDGCDVCPAGDDTVDGDLDGTADACDVCPTIPFGTGGGAGCASSTLFFEPFANNAAGWTLGPDWQIGPAMAATCGTCGTDPAMDLSGTGDNGLAGVEIGGCAPQVIHAPYTLGSPAIDTSTVPGAMFLSFGRWLGSDYTPYMQNTVEIFDGTSWVMLWQSGPSPGVRDTEWTLQTFDISAYKNPLMQVRFGFSIGSSGVYSCASWNIDNVVIY